MKAILEQLLLLLDMTRSCDGAIHFPFDSEPVPLEPAIDSRLPLKSVSYSFGDDPPTPASNVHQDGDFFTLHHSTLPGNDEGRGVQLFDVLGGADGNFNQQRIARELLDHPRTPVDIRPIALAITNGCVQEQFTPSMPVRDNGSPFLTSQALAFFHSRNGMNLDQLFHDTLARRRDLPRRKADLQRLNLTGFDGLIGAYGDRTDADLDESVERIRQEVFRRPQGTFELDTVTGDMIDREEYDEPMNPGVHTKIALFRFFLEPLGVPVDKWSMSVRGRSRTYTFGDVFGRYITTLQTVLQGSLPPPHDCNTLINASNAQFTQLPAADAIPTYAEVQRIFNRSCTECHHGVESHRTATLLLNLSEGMSYDDARDNADLIMDRITRTDRRMMPRGGPPLSKTDIETIERWLASGKPGP